jgi:hypothetical protein
MAKRKGRSRNVSPQLVVRISEDLDQSLREAASGLELDLSALVRLILVEHVAEYVERGVAAEERLRHAREKRGADKVVTGAVPLPPANEHERSLVFGPDRDRPDEGTPSGGSGNPS